MIIHPEGPGRDFLIIISILLALSTIAITLRIWARLEIRAFWIDDWLMVAGWALLVFCCIADYFSISYGVGAHAWRLTEYQKQQAEKWFLIAGVAYVAATAPVKASICMLIIRITPRRSHHWILYGVIFASTAGSVIRIGAFLGRCQPVEAAWTGEGKCGSAAIMTNVAYFFGALCIATDWICAILPAFVVWKIQLSWKAKLYVGVMLALGVLASVATIVRMKYLLAYQDPDDYVYGITDIAIWSEVECTIGIVAGSLATMRPLLRYLRVLGLSITSSSKSTESEGAAHRLQAFPKPRRSSVSKIATSYKVVIERGRDAERGDEESDGGSQRRILPDSGLEIFKAREVEVTIEDRDPKKDYAYRGDPLP